MRDLPLTLLPSPRCPKSPAPDTPGARLNRDLNDTQTQHNCIRLAAHPERMQSRVLIIGERAAIRRSAERLSTLIDNLKG